MAVKMRLSRHGSKKRPFYHVVTADSRMPRDGRYLEKLGYYNPMVPKDHKDRLVLNEDRVKYWLGCGAQPTDRVARFLAEKGIIEKREIPADPLKSKPKAKALERLKEKEEKQKAALAAAAEPAPVEVEIPAAEEPVAEQPAPVEEVAVEAPAPETVSEEASAVESSETA